MKHLTKLHMMALTLAFMMFSGTSVFAADRSNALNEDSHLLSTSDFKVLSGLSANPMNEAELDEVQGKFTPNPECYPGCLSPRGPFPWPWPGPVCLSCPFRSLKKNIFVRVMGPEPVPWVPSPEQQPWKGLVNR